MTIKHDDEMIVIGDRLPVIPLREIVVFPFMTIPLPIAREKSIKALEKGMSQDRLLFLTAQRNSEIEEPTRDDVYRTGVVARILQVSKLPNGVMRVLVEGLVRARVTRFVPTSSYMQARVEVFELPQETDVEVQARLRAALGQFTDYVKLNQQIPDETLLTLNNGDEPGRKRCHAAGGVHRGRRRWTRHLDQQGRHNASPRKNRRLFYCCSKQWKRGRYEPRDP